MQKGRRTWQSFEEMRKAAEDGDAQAQSYLGVCFQNGQGVHANGPAGRNTRIASAMTKISVPLAA